MEKKVRVRFAPSPTGGLHLGGVRTVLYNYLFAKKQGGDFILRIEDTDQTRFVEGAEDYIFDCLDWCGLTPDESLRNPGPYGPYRQSERRDLYLKYALQLVENGFAYYAFDTPEDIEKMRHEHRLNEHSPAQYDHRTRQLMKNSLTLSAEATQKLLAQKKPFVISIKTSEKETVVLNDAIRGEMTFQTETLDDKVLLKADGMPTYHLAVVVDDYLMKITHAFRGEEWLPSAPVHVLLWKYLGWEKDMPQWAHLPLILKPDGHGKLSKRDGERLGFPVFPLNWTDPKTGETAKGYREFGFLPDAFINLLAMLGWSSVEERELYNLEELIDKFSLDRVHVNGAKFDFEKAKWFNQQYLQSKSTEELLLLATPFVAEHCPDFDVELLNKVIPVIKERCVLLSDFWEQGAYFFQTPVAFDTDAIAAKWKPETAAYFNDFKTQLSTLVAWQSTTIEQHFLSSLEQHGLKKGEVMLPFRIMLVGGKFGPGVFQIAELLGQKEVLKRMDLVLGKL